MATSATSNKDKGNVGQAASQTKDKAQEAASSVADKAREMGSTVADKARDIASTAADKARELGSSAANTADSAAAAAGSQVRGFADTMRHSLPREGMMGSAAETLTGTVEGVGRYLEDKGVSGAAEDLTAMIRNHPIPAVLIGIGLGFMLARLTRS